MTLTKIIMRKMLSFVVAFLAMTTDVFAQSTVTGTSTTIKSGNIFSTMTTKDYNRFYLNYNPISINWEDSDTEMKKVFPMENGLSFGYIRGINVDKSLPLYVETGANLQYIFGARKDKENVSGFPIKLNRKLNMFALNIPINLAFRFSFDNNNFSITPYMGLNFRFNLAGTLKESAIMTIDMYDEEYKATIIAKYNIFSSKAVPSFDEDDQAYLVEDFVNGKHEIEFIKKGGMEDYALERFQIGFNVGVAVNYKLLHFGFGYASDFNKIANSDDYDIDFAAKLGIPTISLGITF